MIYFILLLAVLSRGDVVPSDDPECQRDRFTNLPPNVTYVALGSDVTVTCTNPDLTANNLQVRRLNPNENLQCTTNPMCTLDVDSGMFTLHNFQSSYNGTYQFDYLITFPRRCRVNFDIIEAEINTSQPSTSSLTLLFPMTTSISVTPSINILSTMATPTPTNILEEDTISSTNSTINGLEPTYPSLERTCPACSVSMVTITKKPYDCLTNDTQVDKVFTTAAGILGGSLVGVSVLILVCTVLVHIVICWIRTKSLRQDTVPHQVIPQYENVDMITNTLPTTELEMNTCAAYGVIN